MFQKISAAIFVLSFSLFAENADAVITLSQDFDSGSLQSYSISGNTITLEPRYNCTNSTWSTRWWSLYFEADGVSGTNPLFKIEREVSKYHYPNENERFVYSYDKVNWHYFDKGYVGSNTTTDYNYYFTNNSGKTFTSDTVYVSLMPSYEVSKTTAYVDSIKSNQYVLPTAHSVDGVSLIVGHTLGTADGDYHDDMGRDVPSLPLYGFHVTDTSSTASKTKIVLMAGNHSSETLSNYVLEGMVSWLVGDSAEAAALRQVADFYVYPQVDPEGRYSGYFRNSPTNDTVDHNRIWKDTPSESYEVLAIKEAMRTDTGGATYLIDFHTSWADDCPFGTTAMRYSDFYENWQERDPDYTSSYRTYNGSTEYDGMAHNWATYSLAEGGLGCLYTMSPENEMAPGVTTANLRQRGANIGLAFFDTLVTVPEPSGIVLLLSFGGAAMMLHYVRRRNAAARK